MIVTLYPRLDVVLLGIEPPSTVSSPAPDCLTLSPIFATMGWKSLAGCLTSLSQLSHL